jgi:hypothetical protein
MINKREPADNPGVSGRLKETGKPEDAESPRNKQTGKP